MSQKLSDIRQNIDDLDQEIQRLINERAKCAQRVAEIKLAAGETNVNFYRPEREAQVLRSVMERNEGPLANEEMARLFREVMSACLALEQPMKIGYLGPEGTYTQAAALKHFGHSVRTVPLGAIDEVFREVEAGVCHYGVVPVENSTEGVVSYTLDSFVNSPLQICGEVELRIHHCLMSKEKSMTGLKVIYAHQQTLAQCRKWLDESLAGIERIAVSSNAEAARLAAQEAGAGAIAAQEASEIYDLSILKSNIEDEPDNTTRFLVIGRFSTPVSGKDKTSMLLSTKNKPGALAGLLKPLADAGISMCKIESRPSRRGVWQYVFFVDIEGHRDDESVARALSILEGDSAMLKILGSYPVAVL